MQDTGLTPNQPVARILLVDDDQLVRLIVGRYLALAGHEVLEAADGASALAQFCEATDLVVSDVLMPGMSGPELVARLRRQRPSLRVLFITGFDAGAFDNGPGDDRTRVLRKPFSREALLAEVDILLQLERDA